MKTRLAPTPSGFLHAGNAWSFVLTWLLARSQGGTVRLRIDDLDTARFRDGYGEDIFASLRWLGLDWDTGPRTVAEVKGIYSQQSRLGKYRAALEALAGREEAGGPLIYACACSREQVKRAAGASGRPGVYPGTCRDKAIAWRENFGHPHPALDNHPLRARVPSSAQVTVAGIAGAPAGSVTISPAVEMGDFVIWQRNGEPAYQLASLVDDEEYGMDCIVRGSDLLPSTGAQMWLAERLEYTHFRQARFLHHGLLLDSGGGKLSKSEGAVSLRAMRERWPTPEPLLAGFATWLGIGVEHPASVADLLPGFAPERIPLADRSWADFCAVTGLS